MKAIAWVLAAAVSLGPQSDEEKAVEVYKTYLKAIKESDFEKAAEQIHAKSLVKVRERVLKMVALAPAGSREEVAKSLGFKDPEELRAASPRAVFATFMKNLKNLGEGMKQAAAAFESADATIIGALNKDGKLYIVAEATYTLAGESHVASFLQVAYRDGDAWKLAHRGETNIGK